MDDGEDNARVKNRQVAKAAAQVLELESAGELCFALTTLRTETRGQLVTLYSYRPNTRPWQIMLKFFLFCFSFIHQFSTYFAYYSTYFAFQFNPFFIVAASQIHM